MKNAFIAIATILLFMPFQADAAKPILNMVDVPIPIRSDGSTYQPEEVRAIIIEGCLARRWSAVIDGTGIVRATLNVKNKHFAEIEIRYTASAYSIFYVSSDNLDYNESKQRIHRNYNNWVLKLSRTIDQFFRRPAAQAEVNSETTTNNGRKDIYAEILKLDDLRTRGLLTDEEFDSEKRKLLTRD